MVHDAPPAHQLSPDDQARYEEALLTPPDSIDLIRGPRELYLRRMMTPDQDIAELFHENSKLTPGSLRNTVLDERQLAATMSWYFETAYKTREGDFDDATALELGVHAKLDALPSSLAAILGPIAAEGDVQELLFGLDLWLLVESTLYRMPPASRTLWLEQRLSATDLERLMTAVPTLTTLPRPPDAVVFIGIAPRRYTALQGVRGYRRCLMDCGRLVQRLLDEARRHGARVLPIADFYDVSLDNLLMLDGVERSVVTVMAYNAQQDAGT
jgi:hypothetical protein